MLKTFLATSCAISLVACVKQDDVPQDLDRALPRSEQVSIKLPDSASSARATQSEVLGQLANYYVATRDVTRTFNGATAWVLTLLHTIVRFPVTSTHGDTLTWGPWTEPLNPAEYKLDVRVVGDGTYEYKLLGRNKTQTGAQFEAIIDGKADPRSGDDKGNGQFLLDLDASKRVNPIDSRNDKGSISVHYDIAARHLDLTIMSTDDAGKPVIADYAYNDAADGSGNMVFDFRTNAGGGPALESATLRSRWLSTGAGRSDARIGGGDLGAVQATASECWDASFKRVYYTDSVAFAPTEGQVASCAYGTADLPAPQ